MNTTDLMTIHAMRERGGSFVQALARAALLADPENLARLKTAFPNYWEDYSPLPRPERGLVCQLNSDGTPNPPQETEAGKLE